MTEPILPPPCPQCSGKMALKEMYKTKGGSFMCFFRCENCGLQYPRAIGAVDIELAGWKAAGLRKRPEPSDPRE